MTKRSYIPGDEWLYYKIYCGVKTTDEIIPQVVLPISILLKENNIIDKWFFIRYADPDLHLRVRFHFSKINDIGIIMHEVNNKLQSYVDSNKIWKVMFDTYHREIERYHPKLITHTEDLFWIDSETAASFLDSIDGDEGEKIRWMFAFKSIDAILSDFGLTLDQKLVFMEKNRNPFADEFGMNKNLKLQLDQKYRGVSTDIQLIMNLNKENAGEYLSLVELLEQRTNRIIKIVTDIKKIESLDKSIDTLNLLSSYVHMLMNRIFRSKQRMHEMVVYDFLYRHYKSTIAREKSNEKKLLELDSNKKSVLL